MLDADHGENLNTQRMKNEGQENNMGNQNICQGAIGNDSIKGFCEVISKMVKEIGDLKIDLSLIKSATMGEKPLSENVKELMVAINKAEAIEAMVSKIMETKKKVMELEGIRDDKSLEINLNNLVNRVDKMELTIKGKDDEKDQTKKTGHDKRTRANTQKQQRNALFRQSKRKKRKKRKCNGKQKNPIKQPEGSKKEKRIKEAQSVIIPDMVEQQENINMENPEIPLLEEGKKDQMGKDNGEQQDINQEDQRSDNLEDEEI
ncbi:uncharacterized protein LOC131860211 [Cryptomeria japonica]|uniref:uncharacterized protein LOC131860211 n=1 Tax=Cryptomeria japonica TaxID=3369 RepID=UPI0027DA3E44|nr:uncharacterized protein LOC131860211 [Cryptomeria japonica]